MTLEDDRVTVAEVMGLKLRPGTTFDPRNNDDDCMTVLRRLPVCRNLSGNEPHEYSAVLVNYGPGPEYVYAKAATLNDAICDAVINAYERGYRCQSLKK